MQFKPTHLPAESKYPKLIRDRIPEIIKKRTGRLPLQKIAGSNAEFLKYLLKKIREESAELEHSIHVGNTKEELADILEIIDAVLKLKGWKIKNITSIQKEKRRKNGGFEKRIIMLKALAQSKRGKK